MSEKMKAILNEAYKKPDQKFCFYTGKNNSQIAKALGIPQWDWTPVPSVNVEPYFWNTHTIPLAMGCKAVKTSEGKEWVEHFIDDPAKVHDFEIPDVRKGRTGQILEIIEKLAYDLRNEETLIRMPDIQSPMGVAELMWDQGFYIMLLTNPEEIHEFLKKVTSFIIQYIQAIKKAAGNKYNPACHPQVWSDTQGYYIADDTNSLLSPEMHLDYSIPYINQITDACGPVLYHSCTWKEAYFENFRKIKNRKFMNWSVGSSIDPATLMKEFSGESLLVPHIGLGTHKEEGVTNLNKNIGDEVELIKYFLDSMQNNTTMYLWLHDDMLSDIEKIKRIYHLMDSYGYTPQSIK